MVKKNNIKERQNKSQSKTMTREGGEYGKYQRRAAAFGEIGKNDGSVPDMNCWLKSLSSQKEVNTFFFFLLE